jgi:hypothetical protein
MSNCTRTEPARIYFPNRINKELELNINKLLIYEQFYEIFLSKKYQEKNIFHQKVILVIIENFILKIKKKVHDNNNHEENDKTPRYKNKK